MSPAMFTSREMIFAASAMSYSSAENRPEAPGWARSRSMMWRSMVTTLLRMAGKMRGRGGGGQGGEGSGTGPARRSRGPRPPRNLRRDRAVGARRERHRAVAVRAVDARADAGQTVEDGGVGVAVTVAGADRDERVVGSDCSQELLRGRGAAAVMADLEDGDVALVQQARLDAGVGVAHEQGREAPVADAQHDGPVVGRGGGGAGGAAGRGAEDLEVDAVGGPGVARGGAAPGDPRAAGLGRAVHVAALAAAEAGPQHGAGRDVAQHGRQAARVVFVGMSEHDGLEAPGPLAVQVRHHPGEARVRAAEAARPRVYEEPPSAGRAERDGVALPHVYGHDSQGTPSGERERGLARPQRGERREHRNGGPDGGTDAPPRAAREQQRNERARREKRRFEGRDRHDGAGKAAQGGGGGGYRVQQPLRAGPGQRGPGQVQDVHRDRDDDSGDGRGHQRREENRGRKGEEGDLPEMVRQHGCGEDRRSQPGGHRRGDPGAAPVGRPVAQDPAAHDEDAGRARHGELEARPGDDRRTQEREHQHREAEGAQGPGRGLAQASQDERGRHPGGAGGRRGSADDKHVGPDAGGHAGRAGAGRTARHGDEAAQQRGYHADVEAGNGEEVGASRAREGVPELARDSVALREHQSRRRSRLRAQPAFQRFGGPAPDGGARPVGPRHEDRLPPGLFDGRCAQVRRDGTVGAFGAKPAPLNGNREGLGRRPGARVDAYRASAPPFRPGTGLQRRRPFGAGSLEIPRHRYLGSVAHGRGTGVARAAVGGRPRQTAHEAEDQRKSAAARAAP